MQKQMRFVRAILPLILASLFLAGCSGIDDLCVINRYPFALVLRQQGGQTLTVPARTTLTFHGAGGYNGDGMNAIQVEDVHHKVLGTLNQDSPNVEEQSLNSLNGAKIWNVMLGPPPSPPTVAPLAAAAKPFQPFSIGWIFTGAAFFIAWVEWRAHRNEKLKRLP